MDNTFIPDGKAEDPESYCKEYDKLIDEKGGRCTNTWDWRKWSHCF